MSTCLLEFQLSDSQIFSVQKQITFPKVKLIKQKSAHIKLCDFVKIFLFCVRIMFDMQLLKHSKMSDPLWGYDFKKVKGQGQSDVYSMLVAIVFGLANSADLEHSCQIIVCTVCFSDSNCSVTTPINQMALSILKERKVHFRNYAISKVLYYSIN